MSADSILAEAILRLEYKIDILIRAANAAGWAPMMYSEGQPCPACYQAIQFQVDITNQVVKRVCGCTTGKQPPLMPFTPVPPQPGEVNARADSGPAESDEGRTRR